ncbi:YhbY family RNA-binding protein [Paraburkholderia sediminicola]|uniref:YhbY family RNA-binding protein n=1 Tax=Paraburkholderia sediminicola TaxID=458836 RepID=UPI0038B90585
MPALSLSPAERSALRSQAQELKPVVLIGAEGLTDAVLAEINVHLAAHNLIKIRVSGDERDARDAIYGEICDCLGAAPIQHIGKLLVIWKPAAAESHAFRSMPGVAGDIGIAKKGTAPRIVKVVKRSPNAPAVRRSKRRKVVVRGNERVTAGGNVKRAKKRQTSAKRQNQGHK